MNELKQNQYSDLLFNLLDMYRLIKLFVLN